MREFSGVPGLEDPSAKGHDDFDESLQQIKLAAASQIEDIRQTARARVADHLLQADRFEALRESHFAAARLWREIAESDSPKNADSAEQPTKVY